MSGERRENLTELDSTLRARLLRLDEPVDRSDWDDVVERARGVRLTRYRSFGIVASAVAVLSLALALSLARLSPGAEHPRSEAASLRLALHLRDGSGLVLYSVEKHARSLDNPSDSTIPQTAAIVRSLSGGPFRIRPALLHDAGRNVIHGPLPGDQALMSFHLFRTAGLERTAGSAVLTCQYGFDRNAYCVGAVDLDNGLRLTASGTLDTDADDLNLVVTSGYGRNA